MNAGRWSWIDAFMSDKRLNSTSRLVLHTLAAHMTARGESCWPSQATIADEAGLNPQTVKRTLRRLRELGWVTVEQRKRGNGSFSTNEYAPAIPDSSTEEPVGTQSTYGDDPPGVLRTPPAVGTLSTPPEQPIPNPVVTSPDRTSELGVESVRVIQLADQAFEQIIEPLWVARLSKDAGKIRDPDAFKVSVFIPGLRRENIGAAKRYAADLLNCGTDPVAAVPLIASRLLTGSTDGWPVRPAEEPHPIAARVDRPPSTERLAAEAALDEREDSSPRHNRFSRRVPVGATAQRSPSGSARPVR